uniref:RING-type domain-containing protein n=2 Tax=Ciona savignyi TaxID=51511 RepID=H2YEK8_CIOSA
MSQRTTRKHKDSSTHSSDNIGERKILLRNLNEHITCYLCGGYLVDATTITECLHTFCKSCIVSHIEDDQNECPKCNEEIHHSYPLQYLSFDRTMQDIVEKLVPNLKQSERNRQIEFCCKRNIPIPCEISVGKSAQDIDLMDNGKVQNYHRFDEQVSVFLHSSTCSLKHLKRPFLQCSVHATIKILKKFLAKNLGLGIHKHSQLDILCNDEILGKDHTLMFILVTRWRSKKPPLHLDYRPSIILV